MGGKKSTTTQNVTIPAEVMARYNAVNARAETTAQNPFQKFGTTASDFVAPVNAQQTAGINAVNEAAGSYKPFMTGAASATTGAMGPAYAGIDNYITPYTKNVADTTGAMMRQSNEQAQSGALGTAASSGAFGGDRAGVAAANLNQQNQMAYGKTMADIMNQGYTQALGASQSDLARQMQGGAQLAGIGAQTQAAGLQGAEAQVNAGTLQQQTDQAGKTALINQFMQEQGYPFQVAQFLANIAMGTGALSGSTTSTTQPASFFAGGGRVHKEGGGGVAGPYGAAVGSQPWMESYIPQAYLPVGELMMADPALADQSSSNNMDYINQMIQMGKSIKGLSAEKAYGGGVDAPNTSRSYLSDVIDSQKKDDQRDLMRANMPEGEKKGGLGETLGNVAKILSFFKDGGVVPRNGYYDGGVPERPTQEELLRRIVNLGADQSSADASRASSMSGVAAIPTPPKAVNLGVDPRMADAERAAAATGIEAIPTPEGKRFFGDAAPLTSPRPQNRTSGALERDGASVASDTMAALNMPTGLAPATSPRPQQPYFASRPDDVTGDQAFMSGVDDLAAKYRVSRDDILRVFQAESGINPSAQNSIGATGLIQFTPQTAKNLGTSPEELAGMSRAEQLSMVDKYLGQTNLGGVSQPGFNDLYMSVLWPDAVGKPDDTVLFGEGSAAYKGNAPLDLNGDGSVTKGEAGQWALSKSNGLGGGSTSPAQPNGLAGADISATASGRKPYSERSAFGRLMYDPETNKLSDDGLLAILSGIGTMASSPSRFLGSAVLQGIGGAAGTLAELRQKAPERAAKNLENMRAVAMDTMSWNEMNGANLTPAQYAQMNGIQIDIPNTATAQDILNGAYEPTVGDSNLDKLNYQEFQNGTVNIDGRQVRMQDDPASLRRFINDNGMMPTDSPIGRQVAVAQGKLNEIEARGGITFDTEGKEVVVPSYVSAANTASRNEGNRAATEEFRAAGVSAVPAIDKQLAEVNKQAVIFSGLEGGAMNTQLSSVRAALGTLGFDVPESVTQTEQAVKIAASQMLGELGSGNLPNGAPAAELQRLQDIVASPDLQPDSIKTILAMKKAQLMRERDRFSLRRQWEDQNGAMNDSDQFAYEQWFADNHPFQGYLDEAKHSFPIFAGELGSKQKPYTGIKKETYDTVPIGAYYVGDDGKTYGPKGSN